MTLTPQRKRKPIEDVLCYRTRLRILKLLVDNKLKPSEIAKAIGSNYEHTLRQIEILEAYGILTHSKFGKRIRYYKYTGTSVSRAVQNLIEAFNQDPS
jgi:predicted transcriptional regulator